MSQPDLVIRGRRVLLPDGERAASISIRNGRIDAIGGYDDFPHEAKLEEASPDAVIIPGVVDTHAHINEPGRTEWEGFETATRAAAAGGITTVVDMPLNSIPPTTTLKGFKAKAAAARSNCRIDYGFWGGVIPGNTEELQPLVDAGVLGFKAFLCDSGVKEFPQAREEDLRKAMPILARNGVPLLVHAELIPAEDEKLPKPGREYASYLASRPADWENRAVAMMIQLARETGCRVHIVHLSSAQALPDLARAKQLGIPITAETCPHYLAIAAEDIPAGATHFKCAPPIRSRENQDQLWAALKSGLIDFVVSDHSPCTPALKLLSEGDFDRAWGGIAGLQFSLPVVWSRMREKGFTLAQLSHLMSAAPADWAGLGKRKGRIAVGLDADFAFFRPDATFTVNPAMVKHRHSVTPYSGRALYGVVEKTFLRGNRVEADSQPLGMPLLKGAL